MICLINSNLKVSDIFENIRIGNPRNEKMILIHGFESPYQVWEDYIKYFEKVIL